MSENAYTNNPLIHRDRRLGELESSTEWVKSFACDDMSVLIVCRGPVRKETIDIFREMGMSHIGILLSEKGGFDQAKQNRENQRPGGAEHEEP